MPVVTAVVVKKEVDGNGLVEFKRPLDDSRYGVLSARTQNFGRIWDQIRIGSPVSVEVELKPDFMPTITRIDLIS